MFLLAGFAFLPFLWCVNAIWFFAEAFRKPPYEEQREIKKCKFWTKISVNYERFTAPIKCAPSRPLLDIHECWEYQGSESI
jgi:hypothetical protein